jgi:lysozyme family protein
MADINLTIDFILENEDAGLTGKVTSDAGGVTRWGIASKFHPGVDVANLTLAQARSIYANEYVGPFSAIADQTVQNIVCDCLVNPGFGAGADCVHTAMSWLLPHVEAAALTGAVGPDTISHLNGLAPDDIIPRLRASRSIHYFQHDQGPNLIGLLVRAAR